MNRSSQSSGIHCPIALCRLLVSVCLVMLLAQPLHAQSYREGQLVLDEKEVWDFAESLFAQGEYYRAVTEYKRLLYFFPRGSHASSAEIRMGEAYLLGGEPAEAIRQFDALLEKAPRGERDGLLFRRSLAWLDRGHDLPYSLREPNVNAALGDLRAVSPDAPDHDRLAGFVTAMESPSDVPHRSPFLAGSMSAIIPGLGSAYVGRYAEGGLAFFVNALFISATSTAFERKQPALGGVLGVFALAFYGGSIYTAVNGAHKFNDRAQAAYLDEQRTRFGMVLLPGGIGGTLQRSF